MLNGSTEAVEVEQISIKEASAGKRVLVVFIRFIFNFLQCNRACRSTKIDSYLQNIPTPPSLSIYNIAVNLTMPTICKLKNVVSQIFNSVFIFRSIRASSTIDTVTSKSFRLYSVVSSIFILATTMPTNSTIYTSSTAEISTYSDVTNS